MWCGFLFGLGGTDNYCDVVWSAMWCGFLFGLGGTDNYCGVVWSAVWLLFGLDVVLRWLWLYRHKSQFRWLTVVLCGLLFGLGDTDNLSVPGANQTQCYRHKSQLA